MTRRGTLAYYLAAWVIGCFVVAVLLWIGEAFSGDMQTASFVLTTYFFCLVFGADSILLFAFLLRRWMRFLGSHATWGWFASGALLSFIEISAFNYAQRAFSSHPSGELGGVVLSSLLNAANTLSGHNLWQAPIDGAITALVLCLVDRAFAVANEAAEPKHSPV